jgi:hypothetical protein
MSTGGIFILQTDQGPMDRLLQNGLPSQAALQNEFGNEHFVDPLNSPSTGVNWLFIIMLFVLIFIVAMTIRRPHQRTSRTSKDPNA